jgi:hypothetical protein
MRLVKTPSAAIGMIVANTTQGRKTLGQPLVQVPGQEVYAQIMIQKI